MNKKLTTALQQVFICLTVVVILLTITILILFNRVRQLEQQQFVPQIPQFTEQQMHEICIEEEIY